jgi:hypothetical protein
MAEYWPDMKAVRDLQRSASQLRKRIPALLSLLILALPNIPMASEGLSLDEQVQSIKAQTLELNRDLFILEEELLFPDNTQVAVFLSLDIGEFFTLDAVKLTVDGTVVSNYLYTERQVDALRRGGVHRLYMGNLKVGPHEVVAVFTGRGPSGRDYRRATSLDFEKTVGAKHVELQITDSENQRQPEFRVKEW